MSGPRKKINIDERNLKHLTQAKKFELDFDVNCIAYSTDGCYMVFSTSDNNIHFNNFKKGREIKNLSSKKYGVDHIQFASESSYAVHSSTKVNHAIQYLSLNDNKYLRFFEGHTEKVTGISVSPVDELFLSTSNDKTIRLWDRRTPKYMGIMNLYSSSIATFDPDGLVFAAGMNSNTIKLFDLRAYEKGPLCNHKLNKENYDWTSMRFSPCGKSILINTNGSSFLLVDHDNGEILHTLEGHQNIDRVSLRGSFSADSKYVFMGSSDRKVYVWSVETGQLVHRFDTDHEGTVKIVEFNPKYFSFASAGSNMIWWCPYNENEL